MVSAKTIILSGPTATGKSAIALEVARLVPHVEIISADSTLVYKDAEIGCAKPTAAELRQVPHHLISILDLETPYTAGDFYRHVHSALADIETRGKRALIVGGTGFYLKALRYGLWQTPKADPALIEKLETRDNQSLYDEFFKLDEKAALRIGRNDRYRLLRSLEMIHSGGQTPSELETKSKMQKPNSQFAYWIVDRTPAELLERVRKRSKEMLDQGLIDEVRALRKKNPQAKILGSVGYQQVCDYLDQIPPQGRKVRAGLDGLLDEIILATSQLVKRQRTWFRAEKDAERFVLDQDRASLLEKMRTFYEN